MEKKQQDFFNFLGRKIEKLYIKKFSSQYAFAKEIGCDARTIRRIIRGEQNVSLLLLLKIAESLDISLSDLVKGI